MRLQFGTNATERARGDLPALPVVNMFAEAASTEETGVVLQSRPGLLDREVDMGEGPIRALFKGDGVLDGALYGVSDGKLYRENTLIGSINGSGPFSMAGYEDNLFIAGGAQIWTYDGTTLSALSFPDGANVIKVVVGGSRLVAIRADTEKFYWSDVLSTTIGGLSFASSEQQPDRLKDVLFWSDSLILFGSETVEFWPNTGDATLPFQVLEGRTYRRGIKATGCATLFGPSFAWVTDTDQVCLETPDQIISGPGLEAKIQASTACKLWTFHLEGTEFLALSLDAETWVYSYRSRLWSQFESAEADNWIPQCFAGDVFGSSIDGKTLEFGARWEDIGGTLERRFRAGAPINVGGLILSSVMLRTNPGATTYLAPSTDELDQYNLSLNFLRGLYHLEVADNSAAYANPTIEMRSSRDGGKTWGNWRTAKLGEQGQYRKRVQWMGCGMASRPGVLLEFRVSDPVDFRVSDVFANEGFGGL